MRAWATGSLAQTAQCWEGRGLGTGGGTAVMSSLQRGSNGMEQRESEPARKTAWGAAGEGRWAGARVVCRRPAWHARVFRLCCPRRARRDVLACWQVSHSRQQARRPAGGACTHSHTGCCSPMTARHTHREQVYGCAHSPPLTHKTTCSHVFPQSPTPSAIRTHSHSLTEAVFVYTHLCAYIILTHTDTYKLIALTPLSPHSHSLTVTHSLHACSYMYTQSVLTKLHICTYVHRHTTHVHTHTKVSFY